MYVADLAILDAGAKQIGIGWLARGHAYTKGNVATGVIDRLQLLRKTPAEFSCGLHICEFCNAFPRSLWYSCHGSYPGHICGSNTIHVAKDNDWVYAAPDLIVHYILQHHYCPPQEFCDAVMRLPWDEATVATTRERRLGRLA